MNKVLFFLISLVILFNTINAKVDTSKTKEINLPGKDSLNVEKKILNTDSTSIKDSLSITKDSLKALKQKPLIPLYPKGLLSSYDFGTILSHQQLLFDDYRYTGDFINLFPFGFIRDMGMLGQPNEVLVYGAGFNNVSYLQDGISLNNRFTNAFDLNNLQSESIDSIEIIPSVRGFLYGNTINPVSVNFISKNDFSIEGKKGAYSRLRYYQAPNEEAFIDAIFKTNITQRLIGIFEMTNSAITDKFQNSNYSSWKGNAKLNYLLSDNFNLVGNYNYVQSEVHLFGGLDLDSLSKMTNPPANDLNYPVISFTRYQKNTEHNTYLKLVNRLSSNLSGELTAYYKYNLLEFRQNEYKTIPDEEYIFRDHNIKTLGGTLRETFEDSILTADLIANYEKVFVKSGLFDYEKHINAGSLSGKFGLKLDNNKIIPSVFGKYLYYNDQSLYGVGGDITVKLSNSFSLYGGVSYFQKPLNIFQYEDIKNAFTYNPHFYETKFQKIKSLELGIKYTQECLQIITNSFYRKSDNDVRVYPSTAETGNSFNNSVYDTYSFFSNETYGSGINLKFEFWKILIDVNTTYYFNKREYTSAEFRENDQVTIINNTIDRKYFLPEYTFNGGIYFSDILFNSNLNLKVGFNARAIGIQNLYSYDFETSTFFSWYPATSQYSIETNSTLKPSIVFNFLLIGEIQKRAIIYFTFENLFDKDYYIVPYYRKQGRGMRLGVSWEFLN